MSEMMERKIWANGKLTEGQIQVLYPHVVPGTLCFLPAENKQAATIECQFVKEDGTKCGCHRQVRTSNLFHTKFCDLHSILDRRAKARMRKATKKLEDLGVPKNEIEAITSVDK